MIDTTPTSEELAAATEWRTALEEIKTVEERMRKFGYLDVSPDDHARAHARIEAAALAITIPDHRKHHSSSGGIPDSWDGLRRLTTPSHGSGTPRGHPNGAADASDGRSAARRPPHRPATVARRTTWPT